ncbi:MAG TPA: BlaI/MecI/CopY family transcriptional regulator [Terriglobales bacterium]|nr:BlaI/MecI/CopY family transcriptional regulator [Terriglobales bacterium]
MSFPRFSLRGFLRPRQVARLSLGELERRAMEAVWQKQELSVRDLFEELQKRWAYTTLMTTLDRLHKKGILNRRKEGRAFLYSPRISRKQLEQGIASDLIDSLLARSTGEPAPLLSCFVDVVSEKDRSLLDELERLVREKRRTLKERE